MTNDNRDYREIGAKAGSEMAKMTAIRDWSKRALLSPGEPIESGDADALADDVAYLLRRHDAIKHHLRETF